MIKPCDDKKLRPLENRTSGLKALQALRYASGSPGLGQSAAIRVP